MNLVVEPKVSAQGKTLDTPSFYNPDGRTKTRFQDIQRDFVQADQIRNSDYSEFNDRSLMTYMNDSQKAFNSYVPPSSLNPDNAWRANTVRPITRNKIISIAAHITSFLLHPKVRAQNAHDDEDRDAAMVMSDLMDYSNDQSKYEKLMVFSVISALVNPAVIIHEGYSNVTRTIKEVQPEGNWVEKEIEDEQFSGFQNDIVPVDEFYIGDIYQHEIQRQPFLIWRRVIDYQNARMKYEGNENFDKFVRPGIRVFFTDEHDTFYEQYDDDLGDRLVEEVVYYNRFADLEIRIVNGIMMDDPDQPIRRKDKDYPFAKSGYELIDEGKFFYYKSLADGLKDDQRVVNTLYNMVLDGTFINLMPPAVVFGNEEIDSSVIQPGVITTMSNDTRFETIRTNNNLNAGLNAISVVEKSMSESATDPLQSGQGMQGAQTAFEISRLEQNAKTVLGLFGKMIKFLVEDFGKLRIDTILQHMTIAEGMETTGDATRLRFRNFIVPGRVIEGKTKARKIRFNLSSPGSEEAMLKRSFELLEEADKKDITIAEVNPSIFRDMKYFVKVEGDVKLGDSEAVKKALDLEAYDRAIQNPFADQEQLLKDFVLEARAPGESDKYIREAPPAPEAAPQGAGSNLVSQLTGGGKLGTAQLAGK